MSKDLIVDLEHDLKITKQQREATARIALGHPVHFPLESFLCRLEKGQATVEQIDHYRVDLTIVGLLHQTELGLQEVVLDLD